MRAIIIVIGLALFSTAVAELITGDDALLALVGKRSEKLVRITDKPRTMAPIVVMACAATVLIDSSAKAKPENPHLGKYYHVYVTTTGAAILKDGTGTYPEGTVVLKEKFADETAKTTELFTAMVKRQKGFNPESGDWEYMVISGDAKKITQRGKIASCMECHADYKSTDYITREYMKSDQP